MNSGTSSGGGLGSVKRSMNNLLANYMKPQEEEEEEKVQDPYDSIFGRKIVKRIKDKDSYVEKLNFSDFKNKVVWENS